MSLGADHDSDANAEHRAGASARAGSTEKTGQEPADNAAAGSVGVIVLKRRDQFLFAATCLVALAVLAVYYARTSNWGAAPIELHRQPAQSLDYQIELNSASWVEWSQIPGIGQVLAQRIVNDREQNGPFRSSADLMRVKGIGQKRLSEIRPYLRPASIDDLPSTVPDAPKTRQSQSP
jgi:competence ComEA-like helix-hairpin-helix protein